jgi:hypothetical protein
MIYNGVEYKDYDETAELLEILQAPLAGNCTSQLYTSGNVG